MSKRLQINLTDEAWNAVEAVLKTANQNFKNGRIHFSDAINEMIVCSKVDIKNLQAKHLNLRKSLRNMALQKDPDIDSLIKSLTELKQKTTKSTNKPGIQKVEVSQ